MFPLGKRQVADRLNYSPEGHFHTTPTPYSHGNGTHAIFTAPCLAPAPAGGEWPAKRALSSSKYSTAASQKSHSKLNLQFPLTHLLAAINRLGSWLWRVTGHLPSLAQLNMESCHLKPFHLLHEEKHIWNQTK